MHGKDALEVVKGTRDLYLKGNIQHTLSLLFSDGKETEKAISAAQSALDSFSEIESPKVYQLTKLLSTLERDQ